jgi:transketolase
VEAVQKAIADTRRIITVEDHSVIGGLGAAVAEGIADTGKGCAFKRLGWQDSFSAIGLHEDLMNLAEIDSNGIIANVRAVMKKDFEADDDWSDEV